MSGACLYAAILLAQSIKHFTAANVRIRGGDGKGDGGYRDVHGVWHGHYWVEATWADESFVLDITADQFGAAPLVVIPKSQAPHYVPGEQTLVDNHVAAELAAMNLELAS